MTKHLVDENSNRHSASLGLVIVDVVGRACAAAFAVGLLSGVRVLFVPGNYLKNFRHIVRYFAPSLLRPPCVSHLHYKRKIVFADFRQRKKGREAEEEE